MASLHILVVTDTSAEASQFERMLTEGAARNINSPSFTISHALDQAAVLEILGQEKANLILLDLCAPGSLSLEMIQRFCSEVPSIPVVVLSRLPESQYAFQAMQAGAQDYLDKGRLDADLLVSTIRTAIDRKQIERDLRRSVQELALLDQVRTTLAREVDMPVILRTVVEAVANTFDYQLVSLYTLQGDTLHLQHQVGYTKVLPSITFGEGVISRAMKSGQPILLEDVHCDPAFLGAIEGIVSEIAMPLVLNGQVVGALNVESTKGVKLGEADFNLLIALSKDINIAFERAYLYDELMRSGERFRTSVETLLDGFAIFTSVHDEAGRIIDFRYEYINQAGSLLNQRAAEDHIGRTLLELFPAQEEAGLMAEYVSLVETGTPLVKEIPVYQDIFGLGECLPHAYDIHAVRLGDGFAITWRDVTERHQNQALLEQRNRELALLNHAGEIFNSTLDTDQVLQSLLELLSPQIAPASSFWLVDPDGRELICRQAIGPRKEDVRGWRIPQGEGLVGWVAQHGERLVIDDAQLDPRHFAGIDQKIGFFARNILTIPLKSKEKMLGVLQLMDTEAGAFDPAEVQLVEALAAIAAVAIDNARLYAKVEQLAIQDDLTGIHNRRGFYLLANQLFNQAARGGNYLLLIFCDLDGLKQINDAHGHKIGDQALMRIAQLLKNTFRSADIIGRMGGDEFAVLSQVSCPEEASVIVDRLNKNLQASNLSSTESYVLSMSTGSAIWRSEEPCTLDALLSQADAAMYAEKADRKHKMLEGGDDC